MESSTKEFIESILDGKFTAKKTTQSIGFVRTTTEKKEEAQIKLPPMVVDADGLKLLAQIKDWHQKLPASSILTPHPGEMSVLTGLSKEEIQEDRQTIASKYAKEWGHVVVLKGAFTVDRCARWTRYVNPCCVSRFSPRRDRRRSLGADRWSACPGLGCV